MSNEFVTVKREVLEQAVDWFQCYKDNSMSRNNSEQLADEASTALRAALEQPGVEPVAWQKRIYTTELGWSSWEEIRDPHSQKWGKPFGYTNLDYWEDEVRYSYAPFMVHPGSVQMRAVYTAPQPAHQPDTDKLLRQALEAFEAFDGCGDVVTWKKQWGLCHGAITAIRKYLGEA